MMVNPLNNNTEPWQSTIPNQMPWLNSVPTNTPPMQFGQQSAYQTNPLVHLPVASGFLPPKVPPMVQPIAPLNPTVNPACSNMMLTNPFVPHQIADNMLAASTSQQYDLNHPHNQILVGPATTSGQFESTFLTQLPQKQQQQSSGTQACFESTQPMQQKRSSIEMEDEITVQEAPPTKQQLSESRLFKRFGSLQLGGARVRDGSHDEEIGSDDSEDENRMQDAGVQGRKEFNRYVYLLFKDKKSNNLFDEFGGNSKAMDRLIREERDKLNKAVILWNPNPMKDFFVTEAPDDDDDDDEISYKDHRDFLKSRRGDNDSIIITEVVDDAEIRDVANTTSIDDVMLQD